MIRVQRRDDSPVRCTFCHDEAGELEECIGCGALVHLECRAEALRCSTLGCRSLAVFSLDERRAHVAANGAVVDWALSDLAHGPGESEVHRILREESERARAVREALEVVNELPDALIVSPRLPRLFVVAVAFAIVTAVAVMILWPASFLAVASLTFFLLLLG